MKRFFKIANSFSLKLLKWLWNQTVMIRFNQGLIDFCHRHPKLSLTSLRFVARSASNITVVKPSHDQMTKLDLTHHLHMGIIPWAPGHWFILMFILRLLVNLTVDLFLLRNRTCRTFYSVKLGRVLYVASHSTCIMKNSILVFSQYYLSRDGVTDRDRYQWYVFMLRYCNVLLNMYNTPLEI